MTLSALAPALPSLPAPRGVLQVRFFGPVRSLLKIDSCEIKCFEENSADDFWRALIARFPELEPLRGGLRLARNGEFLGQEEKFLPGDEAAVIPPVSGG